MGKSEFILWSSVTANPSLSPSKSEFEPLTSYNWLKTSRPTIAVPGHPAVWSPKPAGTKTRLLPDRGGNFINENAARCETYPMEPLFRALEVSNPDFSFATTSIITDRASLRRLLEFASGSRPSRIFAINVQRFGGVTMLFTHTNTPRIRGGPGGYGEGFEKEFARWPQGLENSSRHHRVIRYTFCGMEMIVRYEADVVIGEGEDHKVDEDHDATDDQQAISNMLSSLSINTDSPKKQPSQSINGSNFTVQKLGKLVPNSHTAEMKTHAVGNKNFYKKMKAAYPQLWFSHTPNLIIGMHNNGVFEDVKVLDVRGKDSVRMSKENDGFVQWENNNQHNLRKLRSLLSQICEIATRRKEALIVSYVSKELLKVDPYPKRSWLPEDIIMWIGGGKGKDLV
ncbi:hypothetical protein BJ508DRAFT_366103 [Ascobolus immersus RN42]|uniref:Decapping nuclease n=1 Tax=Ascobolus immersus RN42 TaxID=1160509 RepID=A0A3N4HLE4_ASCIM|nr:hypothetical protein BJ508DRAFT_366103 [Ascobolus immersus RN42]